MKYTLSILWALLFAFPAGAQNQDEVIFKALKDELQRNLTQLKLPEATPPFYLSYTLGRVSEFGVSGSLGAVVSSIIMPESMRGGVQLFLGDYHRNSNVNEQVFPVNLPAEVDYDGIRRGFWQVTDMMYKLSFQLLMEKMTYLKENPVKPEEESLDDWQQIPAVTRYVEREKAFDIDLPAFERIVKEVSAVFLDYKEIFNTSVYLSGGKMDIYKQTSEGVSLKYPQGLVSLQVNGSVRTPDGVVLSDAFGLAREYPQDLPSLEELKKQVRDFAERMMKLKDAPKVEEFYSGPVMFEGSPVATLFTSNLLKPGALLSQRLFGMNHMGELTGRFGGQIIDKRLSVKNYTNLKTYLDKSLTGHYEIDAEGVIPTPEITLVDRGMLKQTLNGRTPAVNALKSTGSSRLDLMTKKFISQTAPATIHIQVTKGTKAEKMKAGLLKAAKAQGLKYAYIIRSWTGPASQIFRVDVKTGEETQVRGADLQVNLSKLMNLKEIASTEEVNNYLWNGNCLSSIIYPAALILDHIDINKATEKPEKVPELVYPLQR